jgi:hypothetical protein
VLNRLHAQRDERPGAVDPGRIVVPAGRVGGDPGCRGRHPRGLRDLHPAAYRPGARRRSDRAAEPSDPYGAQGAASDQNTSTSKSPVDGSGSP